MSRSEDWTWLDIIANHPSWGVPKFDLSVQEKSPGMESDGVHKFRANPFFKAALLTGPKFLPFELKV